MNVTIFSDEIKDKNFFVTNKLIKYFSENCCSVYIDEKKASDRCIDAQNCVFGPLSDICKKSDIAIVVGGDGSILKAAKVTSKFSLPILGINIGRIGYMTQAEPDDYDLFFKIASSKNFIEFCEKYGMRTETRMMISCDVSRNGKIVYKSDALNDFVISKGDISRMIDIDLLSENNEIAKYRADGIIISTPTGSTAYSMSAGGAIIDPSIECISVIPVCPYLCINSSPIIFSKNSRISVKFNESKANKAFLTTDGDENFSLEDNDIINIYKSERYTELVKVKDIDFFKLLNIKISKFFN